MTLVISRVCWYLGKIFLLGNLIITLTFEWNTLTFEVIRVRNKDKPWFDDQCRHAFGLKQEAHLRWTRDRSRVNKEEFVRYQVRANETYSEARVSLVIETGMFL